MQTTENIREELVNEVISAVLQIILNESDGYIIKFIYPNLISE